MPRPNALGWIQLTDLHVGQPKEGGRVANIERVLLDDLRQLIDNGEHRVDVVFFTGDVAFRGAPEEYVRASAILGRILAHIERLNEELARSSKRAPEGSHSPLLIPVPGNHDLARPNGRRAGALRAAFRTRDAMAPPLWSEGIKEARAIVEDCFSAYEDWLCHHPLPFPLAMTPGRVPGDRAMTVRRGGITMGVLALNSAYLHLGDQDEGALHLDLSQLTALIGDNPRRWIERHDFTVLLTHHPPASLSEVSRRTLGDEIRPDALFDLHLYGHHHVGGHVTEPGASGVRHLIQGRSLFGAEEDGSPRLHGYTVGRFLREKKGDKQAEIWNRPGWRDHHGWRFGPGREDWGRWRLRIDLGASRLAASPPQPETLRPWPRELGSLKHPPAKEVWIEANDTAALVAGLPAARRSRWLLLSASVPRVPDDHLRREREWPWVESARPEAILAFVAALAERLRHSDTGLIFGGHPSITRRLAPLALRKPCEETWLLLMQAERFWDTFIEDVGVIVQAEGALGVRVPVPADGSDNLERMRELMVQLPELAGSVFIGGMSGIQKEFELVGALRPALPRVAVGLGGGRAAGLLIEDATRDAATGGVAIPGKLWFTPQTAVEAVVEACSVAEDGGS